MNNEEGLLRILNYGEHPTNSLYLVFHFVDELHAVRFKDLITARGLWFEYDEDDSGEIKRYLFAIKKMDRKAALNCNYLVKGEFRSRFIPNNWFRWTLLLITSVVLILAFIDFIKN